MATKGSKGAVVAAIIGNFLVMLAKFAAAIFTHSTAMMSEAIHTAADLLNQILLFVGIVRSTKSADPEFDYGYAAERYVWALISAVGIFFLGCGLSIFHGVESLLEEHHTVKDTTWAIVVLIFALVVEGWVLWVAVKAVLDQAEGKPFFNYMRTEADPATVAVVLEDAAACLGVIIAMVAIIMTQVTGHAYWDAIGSITIGVLLGLIAVWLIYRNTQLLVGASVPPKIRDQVRRIINDNPAVEEIVDMKTRVLDTETYRIKADIRFDGEALAEKLRPQVDQAFEKIKSPEDLHKFAKDFADDVVELLADEIDAIEKKIQQEIPKARHMDLEAD
jgi:zinc transporter 9